MSIDLARTLHDTVDGTSGSPGADGFGEGVGTDLDALLGRVRRRRTRRAVTRGVVGVGAAGAVALTGMQVVGRRGPDGVLPAADPSAAPGACGSDVDDLTDSTAISADLTVASRRWTGYPVTGSTPAGTEGDGAEKLAGRAVTALLGGSVAGLMAGTAPVDTPEAQAAAAAAAAEASVPTESLRLIVTGPSGTVVGTQSAAAQPSDGTVMVVSTDTGVVHQVVALEQVFRTCASGADPGGAPLPDGTYELYALDPGGSRPAVAGGPWQITLEPELPTLSGLPAGYPIEEVPVVGESVVTAVQERGSQPGWLVRTTTDSIGALDSAVAALTGAQASVTNPLDMTSSPFTTPSVDSFSRTVATEHWDVTVREVTGDNGQALLQYQLSPR